jgi:hypothetical protein
VIICHSRRYIFVHIHKTAGESVTEALSQHLTRADLTVGTTLRGKMANWIYPKVTPIKKHSPAQAVRDYLPAEIWDGYFKFAFVREPVDRARSLYGYYAEMVRRRDQRSLRNVLFALPGSQSRDPARWPAVRAFLETSSFSEFIRHPAFSPRHPGTRPQWESVCDPDGAPLLDFVGRFESLETDFRRVVERIGLDQVSLPRRNASRAPGDVASPADRALLEAMYRRDFEMFGYPIAEPVVA